ncbi:hypothetical protein HPO96_22110 [Kribbella sandramycini]|uniref:Uncharacterized protein n=1 Tax=Kribbella sandramycini TaxID=60450 RepID=A0A7Y4L253_9ACTN|nr:hypothetical protein [Kribbella sandramycini]MBB6566395.1 hypothetical protein [Kribbella sandramycini]NOL42945.1 hypothetical protein [Kribbella sandramycini]
MTAAEGNEVILPAKLKAADRVRLVVASGDDLTQSTATGWFDTQRPAPPGLSDAGLDSRLNISLFWATPSDQDRTPGDILDLPGNVGFKAVADLPGTATQTFDFDPRQTSANLAALPRPAAVRLISTNEWGETPDAKLLRVGTIGAGISVPAGAVYSSRLGIKSSLSMMFTEGHKEKAGGIKVELQARAKTTDAWKTYGRYTGNTTTAFDTGIASLGNRQYRLYVPARKVAVGNIIALTPATSTSARSSKTYVKFVSKGFTPAHPARHARVDVWAKIQPAVTVRGMLQVLLKGHWRNVFAVQFRNGSMLAHANTGADRGPYSYRISLPAATINNLPLTPTTSSPFPITIG